MGCLYAGQTPSVRQISTVLVWIIGFGRASQARATAAVPHQHNQQ
jgi:hypothetical protein